MDDSTIPLKQCSKCKQKKPLDGYGKNRTSKDGLQAYCKTCKKETGRQWREANKERMRELTRRWYEENKERMRELTQRWREANRDRARAADKRWHEAHIDRAREKSRRWQETNKERAIETLTRWRKANPDKMRLHKNNRRARSRDLSDTFTAEQWQRCKAYFNGRCAACGRPAGLWHAIAADHWIPLSKGGATEATNIIPLCHSKKSDTGGCNNSKYNAEPFEWLERRFGKTKAAEIIANVQAYFEWIRQQSG